MKRIIAALSMGVLLSFLGCDQGLSGGPGVADPGANENWIGQAEDTFSLDVPATSLNQGETKLVTVDISRGTNFSEDVSITLGDLPQGVMLHSVNPVIKRGATETQLELMAAVDAAVGDFTVDVIGHPTRGADSITEMKISVERQEPEDAPHAAADAVEAKWNEYTLAMETQLDQYEEQYEVLKERAANAQGQAKIDLDRKVAETKVKLDDTSVRVEELKSASADRWDRVKEGVEDAFEDLKSAFAK